MALSTPGTSQCLTGVTGPTQRVALPEGLCEISHQKATLNSCSSCLRCQWLLLSQGQLLVRTSLTKECKVCPGTRGGLFSASVVCIINGNEYSSWSRPPPTAGGWACKGDL